MDRGGRSEDVGGNLDQNYSKIIGYLAARREIKDR